MILETNVEGLELFRRGKVRDTYSLDLGGRLLLMVATDRISAFDVVFPSGIQEKGWILNRMSAFWFQKTNHIIPNHFIDLADEPHVPIIYGGNKALANLLQEIACQSMIVHRAQPIDIECIVRGYITGSAWAEYQNQGTVWGQSMPSGLIEGQAFPEPLFTPTTKVEEHDRNMTWQEVADMVGEEMAHKLKEKSIAVYQFAHEYAKERGFILADTKMEFGILYGKLILIDELLTPDSSRFWDAEEYEPGRSLPNFDKQYVRNWLIARRWNRQPPAPVLPEHIVRQTNWLYREVYQRLTGRLLV